VTQFTEEITRAREGLVSASRHAAAVQPSPRPADVDALTDDLWNQASLRVGQTHALKIRDLDFSDLLAAVDTSNGSRHSPATACGVPLGAVPTPPPPPPPPPPPFVIPPPPLGESTAPPSTPLSTGAAAKTRKTMKLHWKEARPDARSVFGGGRTSETIWTEMSREIGAVQIDCGKLEHLFETRTVDMKSKVGPVLLPATPWLAAWRSG